MTVVRGVCLVVVLGMAARLHAQPVDTLAALPWVVDTFADAHALRRDAAGRLYVADPGRSAVVILERDGSVHTVLTGNNAVRLLEPVDLDPTNGLLLYIADVGAGQIFPVGEDGLYLEPLGAGTAAQTGRLDAPPVASSVTPVGVVATRGGDIWAVDATGQLLRWDSSRRRSVVRGVSDGLLVRPRALAILGERLYVLDDHGIVVFDALGTYIRRAGRGVRGGALRIRPIGTSVALVYPDGVVLFDPAGARQRSYVWNGPPLRDVVEGPEGWLLLTAHGLYRVVP